MRDTTYTIVTLLSGGGYHVSDPFEEVLKAWREALEGGTEGRIPLSIMVLHDVDSAEDVIAVRADEIRTIQCSTHEGRLASKEWAEYYNETYVIRDEDDHWKGG